MRIVSRLVRPVRRARSAAIIRTRCWWLTLCNRIDSRPATGDPHAPVVSLTTYGMRSRTVHLAVESIARGRVKPSRLILWIDEPELLQRPSAHLRRLQDRGLEIRLTANFGPHKKYYPYVSSQPHHLTALVTADDDALYPTYWLAELTDSHGAQPDQIHCYRARVIAFAGAEQAMTFPSIPGTQEIALLNENLNQGRNDHIVRATYSRDDLTLLRSIQAPYEP